MSIGTIVSLMRGAVSQVIMMVLRIISMMVSLPATSVAKPGLTTRLTPPTTLSGRLTTSAPSHQL